MKRKETLPRSDMSGSVTNGMHKETRQNPLPAPEEVVRLLRAFLKIRTERRRNAVLQLVERLAKMEP